jgi:hypothetical protein
MPALNYHIQFAPKVESGEKLHTIRTLRKVPIVAGDTLFHFTGMRTKACRRLGVSVCSSANQIDIIARPETDRHGCTDAVFSVFLQMSQGGGQRRLNNAEITALAKADGFTSAAGFFGWFLKDTEHFTGLLIKWPAINPF